LCESRTIARYLRNPSRGHRGYSRYPLKKNTVPEPHFDKLTADIRKKKASVRRVWNALSVFATSACASDTEKLWQDQAASGQR
jgi:hypothetical protein